jgi:hypothetical protein
MAEESSFVSKLKGNWVAVGAAVAAGVVALGGLYALTRRNAEDESKQSASSSSASEGDKKQRRKSRQSKSKAGSIDKDQLLLILDDVLSGRSGTY